MIMTSEPVSHSQSATRRHLPSRIFAPFVSGMPSRFVFTDSNNLLTWKLEVLSLSSGSCIFNYLKHTVIYLNSTILQCYQSRSWQYYHSLIASELTFEKLAVVSSIIKLRQYTAWILLNCKSFTINLYDKTS